jgi:SNF2 family DNA or RNA helicase
VIYTPHDYQVEGRNWLLSHSSAGLFFPPGLGKTATVLDTFRYLKSYGYINTMLVIAPLRVCYMVWPEEVQEWDEFKHFDVKVIHGKDKESQLAKVKDIGVINPEGLEWLFAQKSWRNKFQGQMLVCDESTLFKNYTSNRFKLLKNYLDSFSRRYILTGTPVPNGLVQLWPQIYILDKGKRLGRYITHFKQKYFIEDRRCYSLVS